MMKKFVAGKGAAGLILAGLMVSSGAMAAAGDVVTGGSGTVKINVPLVTSTCTVTVPTEVNFDPVNKNSFTDSPTMLAPKAHKNFDITLSHCSGSTLKMAVHSPSIYGYNSMASMDNQNFVYSIKIPDPGAGITGGVELNDDMVYDFSGNKPFIITPDSDSYTFTSRIDLFQSPVVKINPATFPDSISGSFTYNVTYM
ncbi:hypothetical protein AH553_26060 [Salmonella enterica subsp. diarizonae]|nr:hypothetical protein [Salmonella enterica subsp. diarizonae]